MNNQNGTENHRQFSIGFCALPTKILEIFRIFYEWTVTLPSFELDSSCGYDSLADVLISSSISPSNVHASEDVVLGTDFARGGFCLFPSAINSFCGGFIFSLFFTFLLTEYSFCGDHTNLWVTSDTRIFLAVLNFDSNIIVSKKSGTLYLYVCLILFSHEIHNAETNILYSVLTFFFSMDQNTTRIAHICYIYLYSIVIGREEESETTSHNNRIQYI